MSITYVDLHNNLIIQKRDDNFGHTEVVNVLNTFRVSIPHRVLNVSNIPREFLSTEPRNSSSFKYGGMSLVPQSFDDNHRQLMTFLINHNNDTNKLKQVPLLIFDNSCKVFEVLQNAQKSSLIFPDMFQQDYFTLHEYRYNHGVGGPIDTDVYINESEPTLSISLFMQYDAMLNKKFDAFYQKYFPAQLRLILVFKTHFPRGNVIVYLDKYMLDYLDTIKPLPMFGFNKDFEFQNLEQDESQMHILSNVFKQFLTTMSEADKNTTFSSFTEQIIFLYDLAANHGGYRFYGNIFAYKFGGPFSCYYKEVAPGVYEETLDSSDSKFYGHISFGYMGQIVRFLIMNSTKYEHNGVNIPRPNHVITRDAHATCPGVVDAEYIRNFNLMCKTKRANKYMLAISSPYEAAWHNDLPCDSDIVKRGVYAGLIQMANFTDEPRIMDNKTWTISLGYPFILNSTKNELIITRERPWTIADGRLTGDCSYGIDEYSFASLFCFKETIDKSIYFVYMYLPQLFVYKTIYRKQTNVLTPIYIAIASMIFVCLMLELIPDDTNSLNIINKIELLRFRSNPIYTSPKFQELASMMNLSHDQLIISIEQFLSVIPTKYHINVFIFNYWWKDYIHKIKATEYIHNFLKSYLTITPVAPPPMSLLPTFFSDIFFKYGSSVENFMFRKFISSDDWCVRPFLDRVSSSTQPTDSGFYDIPTTTGYLLKTPQDLLKR